ncbi:hypothetical protein THAOC_26084, partial [Thalassiosira oceanica]
AKEETAEGRPSCPRDDHEGPHARADKGEDDAHDGLLAAGQRHHHQIAGVLSAPYHLPALPALVRHGTPPERPADEANPVRVPARLCPRRHHRVYRTEARDVEGAPLRGGLAGVEPVRDVGQDTGDEVPGVSSPPRRGCTCPGSGGRGHSGGRSGVPSPRGTAATSSRGGTSRPPGRGLRRTGPRRRRGPARPARGRRVRT